MTEKKFASRSVDLVEDAAMHERDTSLARLFPETSDNPDRVSRGERRARTVETDPHIRELGERIVAGRRDVSKDEKGKYGYRVSELEDDARAARDELVISHLALVDRIAGRFCNKGVDWGDLVQQGSYSLVKAADHFDPDKGKFEFFAARTIHKDVQRMVSRDSELLHIPRTILDDRPRVMTTDREMEIRDSHTPSHAELAEEVARRMLAEASDEPPTEEAIAEKASELLLDMYVLRYKSTQLSLDAPISDLDSDEDTIQDKLPDSHDEIDLADLRVTLSEVFDERDRKILNLRYWGDGIQSEIAKKVGISQMQVSRRLTMAHERLRQALSEELPEES